MSTIRRILCPIDFSAYSRLALDHAGALARRYDATITALHVVPLVVAPTPTIGSPLYPPIVFTAADLEQFQQELQQFVAAESGGAVVDRIAVQGDAARDIIATAERLPADLIVMGTHGRSGFDRLMLGSVTEKIIRRVHCPVLTVPRRTTGAVPAGETLFPRILCATDFSPSAAEAIEWAGGQLAGGVTEVTLLHVLEPVSIAEPIMAGMAGTGVIPDVRIAEEAARQRLLAIADTLPGATVQVVAAAKPYREILRQAADRHSDLIVIGAHGGVAGVPAFGSTTNQIVRQATCPVLSVRV